MQIPLNYMLNNNNIQWKWLGRLNYAEHAAALFLCVSEILLLSEYLSASFILFVLKLPLLQSKSKVLKSALLDREISYESGMEIDKFY